MPFMIGKAPVRRTIKYLEAGRLILKDNIQIFSMNFNPTGAHHEGARDFAFWRIPQIQYKNPNVQVITFKKMTPSPFVRCFYKDGEQMLIDVDGKSKDEILEHLIRVVGKTEAETARAEKIINPANFGIGCAHGCMCDIEGQLPCPQVVPLPHHMRGKFKFGNA